MSLINVFGNEIEQIQDSKIRSFVVDAFDKFVPDFYDNSKQFVEETQRAVKYSETFLEVLNCSDYVGDIVKSAILLQDITRYKMINDGQGEWYVEEDHMHPLSVRSKLMPLLGEVGSDVFDDIMRTIESSHGLNAPIPHVIPSMQDPVHLWILPFCNSLARAYTV